MTEDHMISFWGYGRYNMAHVNILIFPECLIFSFFASQDIILESKSRIEYFGIEHARCLNEICLG